MIDHLGFFLLPWRFDRRRKDKEFIDMELLETHKMQSCERFERTAEWTDESPEERCVDRHI